MAEQVTFEPQNTHGLDFTASYFQNNKISSCNLPSPYTAKSIHIMSGMLSLLFHGLIFGIFILSLPIVAKKLPKDQSIIINLNIYEAGVKHNRQQNTSELHKAYNPPQQPTSNVPQQSSDILSTSKLQRKKVKNQKSRDKSDKAAISSQNAVEQLASISSTEAKGSNPKPNRSGALTTAPLPQGGASTPRPPYPDLARKRGYEGTVYIRCVVNSNGKVDEASVAKSSGHNLLDEAALKTVRKWIFKPASENGNNVSGTVIVPVQFNLR